MDQVTIRLNPSPFALFCFITLGISLFLPAFPLSALVSFISGFFIFWLAGFSISPWLARLFRLPSDPWLLHSTSLLCSLILIPLIIFPLVFWLRHFSALSYFLAYFFLCLPLIFRRQIFHLRLPIALAHLFHPLSLAALTVGIAMLLQIFSYPFMPAPDSYTILLKFNQEYLASNPNPAVTLNRLGFTALSASLHFLTGADLFLVYKYLLPLLVLLSIPPLWLLARTLTNPLHQYVILILPLINPALINEFTISRPQAIFLLFLFYAVGWLFFAARLSHNGSYYLTAFFAALGSLYHPLFALFLSLFIISYLIQHRHQSYQLKYFAIFLIIFIIVNRFGLTDILTRIIDNVRSIGERLFDQQWNFAFPAHFVNVDGRSVGWSGWQGVTKYYAFYVGPLVMLLALLWPAQLANPAHRRQVWHFIRRPQVLPLVLLIALFFLIAEILPRAVNHAYLPERAWQYLSISLTPFIFLVLQSHTARPRVIASLFLVTLLVSVAGATFLSQQIKFTIPDYEMAAAQWIKGNLPADRIIISSSSSNLIRYHAGSRRVGAPISIFTTSDLNHVVSYFKTGIQNPQTNPYLDEISRQIWQAESDLSGLTSSLKWAVGHQYLPADVFEPSLSELDNLRQGNDRVFSPLRANLTAAAASTEAENFISPQSYYLYYAAPHPRHPYRGRPYLAEAFSDTAQPSFPVLDSEPRLFQRVYSDGDRVIIWQVSPDLYLIPSSPG